MVSGVAVKMLSTPRRSIGTTAAERGEGADLRGGPERCPLSPSFCTASCGIERAHRNGMSQHKKCERNQASADRELAKEGARAIDVSLCRPRRFANCNTPALELLLDFYPFDSSAAGYETINRHHLDEKGYLRKRRRMPHGGTRAAPHAGREKGGGSGV